MQDDCCDNTFAVDEMVWVGVIGRGCHLTSSSNIFKNDGGQALTVQTIRFVFFAANLLLC